MERKLPLNKILVLFFVLITFALIIGGSAIPQSWSQTDPRTQIEYPGDLNNVFWFIHISDLHINEDINDASNNLLYLINISENIIKPAFVVATGDLTHDWLSLSQKPDDWAHYYDLISSNISFLGKYYDIPGNHDRYEDINWNGYVQNSARGLEGEGWVGQFHWDLSRHRFIALNTCDQEGYSREYYLCYNGVADFPELSSGELSWASENGNTFRTDQQNKLIFLFGHHSINTDETFLSGLFDTTYVQECYIYPEFPADRGATQLVNIMSNNKVSVYAYGHTHVNDEKWNVDLPGGVPNTTLLVNTASLGESGSYRVFAIDNGGVSTTVAQVGEWPVVLITAPIDRDLGGSKGGGQNLYAKPIPNSSKNVIRALVFNPIPPSSVKYYIDGNYGGDMQPVNGVPNLYETTAWNASTLNPGSIHTIAVKTNDSEPGHKISVEITNAPDLWKVDFDGDGYSDLAGINSAGNIFYTTDLQTWTSIPGVLEQLVAGYFDEDGLSDLAGINSNGHVFYTTNLATWINIPGVLTQLVVGDFNKDGQSDLAGINSNGHVFYTTNLATWTNIPGVLTQIVVGDFNKDGKSELAGINSNGHVFYTTNLTTWTNIPGVLTQLVAGDFDGDGKSDLAGINSNGHVFYTTDLATWTNIPGVLTQLVAGDFDGDGLSDLAGINSAGNIFYTKDLQTWNNIPGVLVELAE